MDLCKIDVDEGIENNKIMEIFPELKDDEVDAGTNMDFFINVTNDINSKTEEKKIDCLKRLLKRNQLLLHML